MPDKYWVPIGRSTRLAGADILLDESDARRRRNRVAIITIHRIVIITSNIIAIITSNIIAIITINRIAIITINRIAAA